MRHEAINLTRHAIGQVLEGLNHFLDEDEQLKLDMLEGESPFLEVVRALLNANEADEGTIKALDEQIEARRLRKERAKYRIERRKATIGSLMDCARLTKLALPEATLSLRTLKARPKVTDADALPDAFVRIEQVRKPDTDAIAAAVEQGASIPGVTTTNGGSSLSVRRK